MVHKASRGGGSGGAAVGRGAASSSQTKRGGRKRASVTGSSPPPTPKRTTKGTRANPTSAREKRQINRRGGGSRGGRVAGRKPSTSSAASDKSRAAPSGQDAVSCRVKVYWPVRKQWLDGTITAFNPEDGSHFVKYDCGEEQWLSLKAKEDNRRLKWVKVDGQQQANHANSEAGEAGAARDEQQGRSESTDHQGTSCSNASDRHGSAGKTSPAVSDGAADIAGKPPAVRENGQPSVSSKSISNPGVTASVENMVVAPSEDKGHTSHEVSADCRRSFPSQMVDQFVQG